MLPVFVNRLYWLLSTVIPALFLLSLLHSSVSVLFGFCLVIFLVSPSTYSLSVFWILDLALNLRLLSTTPPASRLCTVAPVIFGLDPRLPTGPALGLPLHTCLLVLDPWTVHYSCGLIKPVYFSLNCGLAIGFRPWALTVCCVIRPRPVLFTTIGITLDIVVCGKLTPDCLTCKALNKNFLEVHLLVAFGSYVLHTWQLHQEMQLIFFPLFDLGIMRMR